MNAGYMCPKCESHEVVVCIVGKVDVRAVRKVVRRGGVNDG